MNDTISSPDASPMFYVGSSDYYFAVPKSRPDLMNDINSAMAAINRTNPRYNDEVKSNYSAQNSGSASLTNSERSWLKANNNTLTLGYLNNNLPSATKMQTEKWKGHSSHSLRRSTTNLALPYTRSLFQATSK